MGAPAHSATPDVACSSPARIRNSVVLPQPIDPTTERNSPSRISRIPVNQRIYRLA